jgi:hypothetical protein
MYKNQITLHTLFFQNLLFSYNKINKIPWELSMLEFSCSSQEIPALNHPSAGHFITFFLFLQKQLNSILSGSQSRLAKNKPSAIHLCGGAGFFKLGQPKNSIFIGGTSLPARILCWLSWTLFVMIFNHIEKCGDSTLIESCEKKWKSPAVKWSFRLATDLVELSFANSSNWWISLTSTFSQSRTSFLLTFLDFLKLAISNSKKASGAQLDKISAAETVIGKVASIGRNLVYNSQNEGFLS